MPNTYIDIYDYTRSTSGLEYQSLIGNQARFTVAQTSGVTALTVPAVGTGSITVPLSMFDRISIFDGSATEVVQVGAAGAAVGATSIPLLAGTALQYNHAVGVAWCSDGVQGSLADQIVDASSWIENVGCNQSLLATTYTNEVLYAPSMRASINNERVLHFRPRHWPVTAISALSISTTVNTTVNYDVSQVIIDSDKQVCSVPLLIVTSNGQGSLPYVLPVTISRQQSIYITLTYTAGYAYSALPGDLREAAILITSDFLAKRHNPGGFAQVVSGGVNITAEIRGDLSGESMLLKRAMRSLIKYSTQPF